MASTVVKKRGEHGERLVAKMLEQQGFAVLERNYRKRFGEIDLIASNRELLLFVEVKLRLHNHIDLAELVGRSKQHRISAAARAFMMESQIFEKVYRCDVALIDVTKGSPEITYIPDAFQIDEGY